MGLFFWLVAHAFMTRNLLSLGVKISIFGEICALFSSIENICFSVAVYLQSNTCRYVFSRQSYILVTLGDKKQQLDGASNNRRSLWSGIGNLFLWLVYKLWINVFVDYKGFVLKIFSHLKGPLILQMTNTRKMLGKIQWHWKLTIHQHYIYRSLEPIYGYTMTSKTESNSH